MAAPPSRSMTAVAADEAPCTASAVAAPARKRLTKGVAMPSFRPLSTLSTRRTPAGTRSSSMIDAPSAASVGATMAPMAAATQRPAPEKSPAASAAPAPMVSGSPMPRRRTGSARSARSWRALTREASAKSTRASAISATDRMVDECRLKWIKRDGAVGHHETEDDEGDGSRHVPALQAGRDQAPHDDAGGDDGEGGEVEIVGHGGRGRAHAGSGVPGCHCRRRHRARSGPKVTISRQDAGRRRGAGQRRRRTEGPGAASERWSGHSG